MTTTPGWDAETLWQNLVPVLPGIRVEVLPEVASTNSLLLARQADSAPCLLIAERQTQGRGRMGRGWVSAPGASLTFSLALPLAPVRWEGLSLAVGLALADALEPPSIGPSKRDDTQNPFGLSLSKPCHQSSGASFDKLRAVGNTGSARTAELVVAENGSLNRHGPRLQLKWPNDLWLCDNPAFDAPFDSKTGAQVGRKLGGVLIETATRGTQRLCVIGVGLNVLPLPAAASAGNPAVALNHGYACLHELHPGITAAQALARVALPLALALRQFEVAGFAPLVAAYGQRDLLQGRAVTTTGTPPLQGVAQGVDSDGALLVRGSAAGASSPGLQRVQSGEVSVRLDDGAGNRNISNNSNTGSTAPAQPPVAA